MAASRSARGRASTYRHPARGAAASFSRRRTVAPGEQRFRARVARHRQQVGQLLFRAVERRAQLHRPLRLSWEQDVWQAGDLVPGRFLHLAYGAVLTRREIAVSRWPSSSQARHTVSYIEKVTRLAWLTHFERLARTVPPSNMLGRLRERCLVEHVAGRLRPEPESAGEAQPRPPCRCPPQIPTR
jgi:hypothetical protein